MKRKLIFTAAFTAFFIACAFISGVLAQALADYAQWLQDGVHGMYSITIDFSQKNIMKAALSKPGLVVFAGLFVFFGYLYYRFKTRKFINTDPETDLIDSRKAITKSNSFSLVISKFVICGYIIPVISDEGLVVKYNGASPRSLPGL